MMRRQMNTQPYLRISLSLNRSSDQTALSQIVEAITQEISCGTSVAGYRLPPVRALAHQLGVSKNTVQAAYDELVAQGLVESVSRVGLFVARSPEAKTGNSSARQASALDLKSKDFLVLRGGKQTPGRTDLSSVFIDEKLLPIDRLAQSFRSVCNSSRFPIEYDLFGYKPLREKIADRLTQRGIEARPEHIVITVGSQMALDLAFRSLNRKVVGVESPAYYGGKLLLVSGEFQICPLPIDPFNGLDLDYWESQIKKYRPSLLSLVPNFQNPTGYSYSTSERNTILEWSSKYGFGILEDDWGSDMLSFSEFTPSLRARGGNNVLYVNSFTKKLLPSLRMGYIVGNEETIGSLASIKSYSSLGNSMLMEMGLFEFLDRGYFDTHLREVQSRLDDRYRACLKLLSNLMPEEVRWTTPGGGPSLWLNLPSSISLQELKSLLSAKSIHVQNTDNCFSGEPHLHGIRLGYASISTSVLEEALSILSGTLKSMLVEVETR